MNSVNILLILYFTFVVVKGQDEWNGDPSICTPDSNPSQIPAGVIYPTFPKKAEFAIELVTKAHIDAPNLDTIQHMMLEYFYDYDANTHVMIKNSNNIIDVEFYYYNILKKSSYYARQWCNVTNIEMYRLTDGTSAINIDGKPHIRPLEQFLLFSNNNPTEVTIHPKYIGEDTIRGIRVDKWETCIVDKSTYRTAKREWAFAKPNYPMPAGTVTTSIPVQAIITASIMTNTTTHVREVEEIINVLSYKPGIIQRVDAFSPPPGVFCARLGEDNLFSLEDQGIVWPEQFSVRIDVTTSKQVQWQTFHLRIERNRDGGKMIRYDYKPLGDDFESIILDYSKNMKYVIDRQLGSCKIEKDIDFKALDIVTNPIEFFIKYEHLLMENQPTKKVYQFNGLRPCRGSQIECVIVTTSLDNFPEIPATEETWDAMNVEWAWSQRNHSASINCPNPPCSETLFDYPVHLYLKLYRRTHNEGLGFETEDVLYDFYELNDDIHQNEFDVSLCYRSNDLDYLRLAFNLKMNSNENFHLHRHALILGLHREAARVMNIQPLRISNLEVDYDQQDDTVYALFTLLDKTPLLNSPEELNVQEARTKLETAINANNFTFDLFFLFTDTNKITVKAVPNSMADSKQYISLHSRLNRKKTVKYTKGSQTGAVIGGILVGLIVGIILIVAIKYVRKDPLPSSEQLKGTFFTSPFHSRKNQANTQSESNT